MRSTRRVIEAAACVLLFALLMPAVAGADGEIAAWGDNEYGKTNVPSPNSGFVAIAGGEGHSLGLKADGSIIAWGRNDWGQTNVPSPNSGFVAVAGGGYHSLGLKADGSIVAWGRNNEGQTNVPSPNSGFVAVAAGWKHSLGLKADGSIVAWESTFYGACNVPSPNSGFVAIAGGHGHSLGLKADGSIMAWGWNISGQTNVPSPNSGFVAIAGGKVHSLGLKADSDCNGNGIPDDCDINCGPPSGFCDQPGCGQSADCNENAMPDECDIAAGASEDCNGNGIPDDCDITIGTSQDCNSNTVPDECDIATGSSEDCNENQIPDECEVIVGVLPIHYAGSALCEPSPVASPGLLSFTYDGLSPDYGCDGSVDSRLFAGRLGVDITKIIRVRQDCAIHPFGALLCKPESVLIDVSGSWPGACSTPNLIIVGGLCTDGFDRIYFLDPVSGGICQEYVDNTLLHIGQMAIDSTGRLFVGSVDGDCLNMLTEGVVWPFYCALGQSPRAVAVDQDDNVYVTYAGDGVLRVIAPDGTPLNETFATGLEGAVSQAIAPEGIFHGNLFVACGDRVMEVDLLTGESSMFLGCAAAHGMAFDPEGYMHVSVPSEDRILKIGSALPGDMDGSGTVDMDDLPGFVAALLRLSDAPLPIMTADMDGDGCADGVDIRVFVETLIGP